MNSELEVGLEEARLLAKKGRRIFIISDRMQDVEFVKEALCASGHADAIGFEEARSIASGAGNDNIDLERFSGSIIVCPHGNSSLRFAIAMHARGIQSYSLNGGIEMLKSWQS